MEYKKELKKLQKHRRRYYPAVSVVMDLYHNAATADLPVELINDRDALIFLELIDVGYLDEEAMVITRRFGDITGLLFNGSYPLTDSGELFYQKERRTLKRRVTALLDSFRTRR